MSDVTDRPVLYVVTFDHMSKGVHVQHVVYVRNELISLFDPKISYLAIFTRHNRGFAFKRNHKHV